MLASGPVLPLDGSIRETVGAGAELGVWSLGRAGWHDSGPPDGTNVLARSGQALARFRLEDTARPDAGAELAALGARGLALTILSGDSPEKVSALAHGLGLAESVALGGLSPQAKAAWIETNGGGSTLMLGDGANDSLAFDSALCRGTPVICRGLLAGKSDFYYLGRGLDGIRALFEANDARRRTQVQLLGFMVTYNLLAVGLSVAGLMHPLLAAILMPLSSLVTLALVGLGMRTVWQPGWTSAKGERGVT
ncbi:MAG: HAD family hydrolase [Verrucomicrobiota bacterium]